jgi:hypothetical protein
MLNVFKHLPMLAIAVILGAGSAKATIAVEVFTFTGDCADCTGTGMAELILLGGYVLGTPLSADDLVSFNYSSNLIPELSIHNDPTAVLMGTLPIGLGPADVFISGANGSFSSAPDGTWSALVPPADMGTHGVWAAGSPVATPEPATLSMIAIGLAGMFRFRRRHPVIRARAKIYEK